MIERAFLLYKQMDILLSCLSPHLFYSLLLIYEYTTHTADLDREVPRKNWTICVADGEANVQAAIVYVRVIRHLCCRFAAYALYAQISR